MKLVAMALLASLALGACDKPQRACNVVGCSGQLCTDRNDVETTCEWKERYGCYRTAACERQTNGQCDWTMTRELEQCLDSHP